MARRNQGVRARARSKVSASFAQRQAEWQRHQKALEALYRAFEVAEAEADEIRDAANERARRIEHEGHERAAAYVAAADAALAQLRRLGESVQGIAEITGVPAAELRARLVRKDSANERGKAVHHSSGTAAARPEEPQQDPSLSVSDQGEG